MTCLALIVASGLIVTPVLAWCVVRWIATGEWPWEPLT